jgi:DNA-binding CsgD family transcriptional regulator
MAKVHESKENLIRQLVSALGKAEPFLKACEDCAAEEIILDTNVDGVRYLLIRMPVLIPAHVSLSPREQEIVRMVAKGYPTKAIARVLNISCWTVSAHLRRVFMKLGVTSRLAMVARLQEEGRKWDVPVRVDKPLSGTKPSLEDTSQPPTNVTQSRTAAPT